MTTFVTRTFLKGLAVVVPLAAAAYIIYWLVVEAESIIKRLLLTVMPEDLYVPGLGLLVVVSGIFTVGLMMYPVLTRFMLESTDRIIRKVPLVGMVYSPIRDLMDMLGGDLTGNLQQVVMVTIPNTGFETIGFVMQNDTASLPDGFAKDDHVVVYLQMSYQIGGYCFIVPRENIRPVDMTVQQAIRWILMAGVAGKATNKIPPKPPQDAVE